MWGVGLRAQHSSGLSAVGKPRWARDDRERTAWQGIPTAPSPRRSASSGSVWPLARAPRSCSPAGAISRSRRWGCCAPSSSATSSPTSSSGARRARSTGPPSRPRRASAASSGSRPPGNRSAGEEVFPGGRLSPGLEPPHPRRPPLLQPGPPRHLPARRHPRDLRGARDPAPGGRRRPRHRRRGRLRPGTARSPRCSPAPRSRGSTRRSATTAAPWSTARSSTPCRCGTRWPARSTGSTCMNVAGDLLDRPLRSPIDVAVRAFAISRKQRFDLELRNVPESVEMILLPAPLDDRDLFDFSGGRKLMDTAARARRAGPRRRRAARRRRAPAPPSVVAARRRESADRVSRRPGDDVHEDGGVLGPVTNTAGTMPSTMVTPAVTASTIQVPTSTRASLARSAHLAVGRRCRDRQGDAEVRERGDDGRDRADHHEHVVARVGRRRRTRRAWPRSRWSAGCPPAPA